MGVRRQQIAAHGYSGLVIANGSKKTRAIGRRRLKRLRRPVAGERPYRRPNQVFEIVLGFNRVTVSSFGRYTESNFARRERHGAQFESGGGTRKLDQRRSARRTVEKVADRDGVITCVGSLNVGHDDTLRAGRQPNRRAVQKPLIIQSANKRPNRGDTKGKAAAGVHRLANWLFDNLKCVNGSDGNHGLGAGNGPSGGCYYHLVSARIRDVGG